MMQAGDVFGRLTLIEPAPRLYYWVCLCSCGVRKEVRKYALTYGQTRSCGCFRKEVSAARVTVHGNTPRSGMSAEYVTWKAMHARCRRRKGYKDRGIVVCDDWSDFAPFLSAMGRRTSVLHSLDRINNDGNYEPSNCRWATREEQMNNTRKNVKLAHQGEELTIAQWSRKTGVHYETLRSRLKAGLSVEAALRKD